MDSLALMTRGYHCDAEEQTQVVDVEITVEPEETTVELIHDCN